MEEKIIKQLKELIYEFVDESGNIREEPKSKLWKGKLGEHQLNILKKLVFLVLNTRFFSLETKYYIKNRYITLKGVTEKMREDNIEATNNTVRGRVWYDKKRFTKLIGEKVLVDIIEYGSNLSLYEDKINSQLTKYSLMTKFRDSIALKLPAVGWVNSIEDEKFEEFLLCIAPYNKLHMRYVQENIPVDCVGYVEYILGSNEEGLSEKDLERRNIIIEFMGGLAYDED
jgi:hypothetical protein